MPAAHENQAQRGDLHSDLGINGLQWRHTPKPKPAAALKANTTSSTQ